MTHVPAAETTTPDLAAVEEHLARAELVNAAALRDTADHPNSTEGRQAREARRHIDRLRTTVAAARARRDSNHRTDERTDR